MTTRKEVTLSKDDVEICDGKVVIKNQEILDTIQSEQGVNLDQEDSQNAWSIGVIVSG